MTVTVELTQQEANGVVWHLEQAKRTGMNIETQRAVEKIRKAVKKAEELPLFKESDA